MKKVQYETVICMLSAFFLGLFPLSVCNCHPHAVISDLIEEFGGDGKEEEEEKDSTSKSQTTPSTSKSRCASSRPATTKS